MVCADDYLGTGLLLSGLAVQYGPQIMSYAQSLTTPVAQYALHQAVDDAKSGHPYMAIFGALTAGEVPDGKITPVFENLWSVG